MKYTDPALRQALAQEYVLGGLVGGARRRFEALMARDSGLFTLVMDCEQVLHPIADSVAPVTPPAHIRRNLTHAISAPSHKAQSLQSRFWDRVWRVLAVGNGLAAATLGLFLFFSTPAVMNPAYLGVLFDEQDRAAVVVGADKAPWRITIKTLITHNDPATRLQLWAVDRDSGLYTPIDTLGATTSIEHTITEALWQRIKNARRLVVSAEPVDRPLQDKPSGAILYSGICVQTEGVL